MRASFNFTNVFNTIKLKLIYILEVYFVACAYISYYIPINNYVVDLHPTVNTTPLLRDLYNYITPQYATKWRKIGTQLGLPTATLDIIKNDHKDRAEPCCNAMLKKWLQVDTTASWSKLFTVIESPTVSCSDPDKGS